MSVVEFSESSLLRSYSPSLATLNLSKKANWFTQILIRFYHKGAEKSQLSPQQLGLTERNSLIWRDKATDYLT